MEGMWTLCGMGEGRLGGGEKGIVDHSLVFEIYDLKLVWLGKFFWEKNVYVTLEWEEESI